jgi:hypothetical protein
MAEQSNEFANSLCFAGGPQRDRQRFGESLSSTLLVATSPAARANLQRRRNPLNWKRLRPSHLPTVARPGSFPEPGHDRLSLPSADTTQRFPWNDTPFTIILGPKANFVVFVILQIVPKQSSRRIQHEK